MTFNELPIIQGYFELLTLSRKHNSESSIEISNHQPPDWISCEAKRAARVVRLAVGWVLQSKSGRGFGRH